VQLFVLKFTPALFMVLATLPIIMQFTIAPFITNAHKGFTAFFA